MPDIPTNRDVYTFVRALNPKDGERPLPTLEVYLRSLLGIVLEHGEHPPSPNTLLEWLKQALEREPPAYDPAWEAQELYLIKEGEETFKDVCTVLIFQIVDLKQMRDVGVYEDDHRSFGLNAPSGRRWYNFSVLGFLECGVRGTMGGYEESEVIVLIEPPAGESADSEIFEITEAGWSLLCELLWMGQEYE